MDPLQPIPTTNLDAGSDSPLSAQADLLEVVQRINGTGLVPCSQFGTLNQAVAAIGSTVKTLAYGADITVSANIVIPANIELLPYNGAKINHSTYTISYSGSTKRWPSTQIFNGTGAVTGFKDVTLPVWWGATNSALSTTAVQAAVASGGKVVIPEGFTYIVKNIAITTAKQTVEVNGTLQLPSSCADNDAVFVATSIDGIRIVGTGIIDGNKAGQSGTVSQQLIRFLTSNNVFVGNGLTFKKNYSGASTSYAAIYITGSNNKVDNIYLFDWSKEGVYLNECSYSSVLNVIAIDVDSDSWSAVQVGGSTSTHNRINDITAKNTGASAVGLDSKYSSVSDIVVDTVRFQNGVNLGHTGKPASYSTVSNIVVKNLTDNANVNSAGVNVGGDSVGVEINNVVVDGSTQRGINISDGATDVDLSNIRVKDCLTGISMYKSGQVKINKFSLHGTITTGIIKDSAASSDYTTLHATDIDLTVATNKIAGAATGLASPYTVFQTAVFDNTAATDSGVAIAGLGAGGTVTVTNANARANSRIILEPSNVAGMNAMPFISTQNDGNFVVTTVNNGAAGAFVRWKIV